jgi:hypothetical protein
MWQDMHRANVRDEAYHGLWFWGLLLGASALHLAAILALGAIKDASVRDTGRVAVGLTALGMVGLAASNRKDYEASVQTNDYSRAVIARNKAAWINMLTQPTRKAMGLIQTEALASAAPTALFDWHELADSDNHPVLAIVSPMGGGKSRLAKFLAKHVLFPGQAPEIRALDIYGRVDDWQDASLVTEHGQMLNMMRTDLVLTDNRTAEYRQGRDQFRPLFWILEEAPDTINALRKVDDELVQAWITRASTVARKIKARLCLVSVRLSGAEIGIAAEARSDATVIFPGRKGIAKAMADDRIFKLGAARNKALREQLSATLANVQRPALVYYDGQWFPASVPELDAAGNPPGVLPVIANPLAIPQPEPEPQPQPEPQLLPVVSERQRLEQCWQMPAVDDYEPEFEPIAAPAPAEPELSEDAKALALYISKRRPLPLKQIQTNWHRNGSRQPKARILELLAELNIKVIDGKIL